MGDLWAFLNDPANRDTLTWLGGGLAVAIGAAWTAFTWVLQRKPADKPASSPPVRGATSGSGIAASGNIHVGGDVRIEQAKASRGGLVLAGLGLLVLIYAILTARGPVNVEGGAFVGGNVTGSTINVQPAAGQ